MGRAGSSGDQAALEMIERARGVAQNLDSRPAAQVLALGKVDDAHAALAQQANNSIGAEQLLWKRIGTVVQQPRQDFPEAAVQQGSSAGVLVEHPRDRGFQLGVAGAKAVEQGRTVLRRLVHNLGENLFDAFISLAIHHVALMPRWFPMDTLLSAAARSPHPATLWRHASPEAQWPRRRRAAWLFPQCPSRRNNGSRPPTPGAS